MVISETKHLLLITSGGAIIKFTCLKTPKFVKFTEDSVGATNPRKSEEQMSVKYLQVNNHFFQEVFISFL